MNIFIIICNLWSVYEVYNLSDFNLVKNYSRNKINAIIYLFINLIFNKLFVFLMQYLYFKLFILIFFRLDFKFRSEFLLK